MKIVTWNINGIRTFKGGIKKALDLFDADVICFQETKVTRDLLDERTAIVDGYNSYFSFSRARSGYSGVATFCKETATPIAAEEGLTGLLTNHSGTVGCYGDQSEFSTEELQTLDNEGRVVITQHRVMCGNQEKTLTILNVYCPRADPEKPERKLFKLQFYRLLQTRAETILGAGSYVIVLGDVNTSHRPIDHCDPDDLENFEDNPGRKWLNGFLFEKGEGDGCEGEGDGCEGRGRATGTNYGTRIDYILADRALAEGSFLWADIMPEVQGSDHCPVQGLLACPTLPAAHCPPLCTRLMPEFAGRQQKLSRFLVLVEPRDNLPGSQELEEIRENLRPPSGPGNAVGNGTGRKRGPVKDTPAPRGKKNKVSQPPAQPQRNLLAFFRPKCGQDLHSDFGKGQEGGATAPSRDMRGRSSDRWDDSEVMGGGGGATRRGEDSLPPDVTGGGATEGVVLPGDGAGRAGVEGAVEEAGVEGAAGRATTCPRQGVAGVLEGGAPGPPSPATL
ncbi:hypothetical protein AAFF_G00334290 [Aldrovandia affinis]|uniref:DNA-(apurinic or apyrimidinic site) endonuclease n=1 Tax=Aldrovandia affinis TaxID=143900 RepID=A0AAD7SL32_9TELE|nr:hypothetical protein AAFF_G00334290 [Aldrovandia affinis]